MNFHLGQQVVCVDVSPNPDGISTYTALLRLRSIYTIRGVTMWANGPGVLLEEIILPPYYDGREMTYWPWRFRPVKTTDISCFTAVLKKTPKRVKESA
jgi:hypothetical protein